MELQSRLTLSAFQFLALALACIAQYIPPTPEIVPLSPRGVRMSIPDEAGITLVAYHAKINEDFYSLEAGTIARDIIKKRNGRWTYEDHETRLNIGDTIYVWIHVVYNGLGYNLLDQSHLVTQLTPYSGAPPRQPIPTTTQISTVTRMDPDSGCQRSITIHNNVHPCVNKLLFEEHFNSIQTDRWRTVKEIPGAPDYEFVVYQDNPENLIVRNGELQIKPTLMETRYDAAYIRRGSLVIQNCTGQVGSTECSVQARAWTVIPPVASAMIDTKQSFQFLYGRVEIRAKLPRGDWIYPVLALRPKDNTHRADYKSGELRIASTVGNRELRTSTGESMDGHELRGGAVVSVEGHIRQGTMSRKVSSNYWSDDYHVYELEWNPTGIKVKVDGEDYGTKEGPALAYRNEIFNNTVDLWSGQNPPFDRLFYLSVGVAVGGHGQFSDYSVSGSHTKPWRNREAKDRLNFYNAQSVWANTWTGDASVLKVDYVKVWALE